MNRYFSIIGLALLILAACSREERLNVQESRSPIVIQPCYMLIMPRVDGEVIQTKSAPDMVDFPGSCTNPYKDPVALFGFYLEDESTAASESKGYFGETKTDILASGISNQHAADVLQENVHGVDPERTYTQFITNAKYIYSSSANAFIANDIAAFWRPDAYHYLLCYAPPIADLGLGDPLVVTLRTNSHGIQEDPDFNFLYGRRVLLYNEADLHGLHHKGSVEMYLAPMLSKLNLHFKCDPKLKGLAVLFGIRVKTYKQAEFHLDTGTWTINTSEGYQTITRYFDEDYLIPNEWKDADDNKFTLSLFPNIANATEDIGDSTLEVIKEFEVCVNNTWIKVLNLEETDDKDGGVHKSNVVPLAPGYKTNIYLTISTDKDLDEWNNLLITFSNWKMDDVYEYNGTFE